ncbi:MAG: alanine dehydrogenase [Xanthomonadales bacterium]|nr:alanine dehydrogenase [Gammaproteobacteria bacterium]MBT8051778.1 alanine dehydrogenase [Gammaproteobacteria bacterium]MBT8055354.1 alanine dehydrogenase [Gammaproteobacteria bacterium]NNJ79742.1 alanine dehydrogenase [Xanthomonadales bacterium]NNL05296.1 alanine dehydrogenase [Xanthomonadales bacterium]
MRVGVPKEIKNHEYRVGLTPASVRELTLHGHDVYVQSTAGAGIGVPDERYEQVGATILPTAEEVFDTAEMIVKVKEPQAVERAMLREDHVLFTYLHLAPDAPQTEDLVKSGACCIAYETVTDRGGHLPLLAPMSEVAGRLSIQAGAWCLEKAHGGLGVLMGGVPGVEPAKVVIIGGGTVGFNAAQMAIGLGARVVVMDRDLDVMRFLDANFESRIETVYSNADSIEKQIRDADLVVGGVLIPGAAAPKLVSRAQLSLMKPGAVLVDVAIDQGGCFETSRPTTHAEPTYEVDGIVHYCVANMPGAVPRTSTFALNNATLPFTLQLANQGAKQAMLANPHLLEGLNVYRGKVTYADVARDLGYDYFPAKDALAD